MDLNLSTIFLMTVLILGIASYPTSFSINQNSSDFNSINPSLIKIAFAQEEDEDDEESEIELEEEVEVEEEEEEPEEEIEDEVEEEEIEIEVEVEDGIANVKVEIGASFISFEFELVSTEPEDIREEIVSEILARTDLTIDQIGEFEIEFEEELEAEEEGLEEIEEDEEEEIEIEVEVKKGKTKIKIEFEDEKLRFVLDTTDESEILSLITEETGLDESQVRSIWDFEIEEDEEYDEKDKEKELSKLSKHEDEAKENAEQIILKLQQKIEELEQRLQTLLEKFEAGEYFGSVPEPDPVPASYSISFVGSATSLDDQTIVTDVDGEIFLETLVTKTDTSKFRITGGEILVGDTFYDFVIGKARVSSTGTSGEKDSLIIIGQVMDEEGNVNTIKILLDAENPLTGDFGLEPVEFEITSKSKIAKQWNLSAWGQLSLLEV